MLHFRGGRGAISRDAYPDMEDFFADVATCYQDEIRALGEAGCTYLQLDDTNLAYLCDPRMREGARQRGDDPDELPRRYARLSPQCGFSSTDHGNQVTQSDREAKMRHVVATAREVWGEA